MSGHVVPESRPRADAPADRAVSLRFSPDGTMSGILAVVTSGTDGTDAERERVADRAEAERVFARHGNHW